MNYEIKESKPCADYEKISIEGRFHLDRNILYDRLKNTFDKVSSIDRGKIIIAKRKDIEMYLYDDNRFVASKVESEELGQDILSNLFM